MSIGHVVVIIVIIKAFFQLCWGLAYSPHGFLRFNMDAVARRKPGPAGIAGVLHDEKGNVLFSFSKRLGVQYSITQRC